MMVLYWCSFACGFLLSVFLSSCGSTGPPAGEAFPMWPWLPPFVLHQTQACRGREGVKSRLNLPLHRWREASFPNVGKNTTLLGAAVAMLDQARRRAERIMDRITLLFVYLFVLLSFNCRSWYHTVTECSCNAEQIGVLAVDSKHFSELLRRQKWKKQHFFFRVDRRKIHYLHQLKLDLSILLN